MMLLNESEQKSISLSCYSESITATRFDVDKIPSEIIMMFTNL